MSDTTPAVRVEGVESPDSTEEPTTAQESTRVRLSDLYAKGSGDDESVVAARLDAVAADLEEAVGGPRQNRADAAEPSRRRRGEVA